MPKKPFFFNSTKINPDLIKSEINTSNIAKNIYYFDDIESTNEYAKNLAEKGEPEGTLIIADHQQSGKGRLQRTWFSPRGVNLYVSIILRPNINIKDVNLLTLISSISTVDTVSQYGIKSAIKWPNDVVVNEKKLSGVLTEIITKKNIFDSVVIGIGININLSKQDLELYEKLSEIATSVYIESGTYIDRNKFLLKLLKNIDTNYYDYLKSGKEIIINKWMSRWNGINRKVIVNLGKETVYGICKSIDENGYLIIEKPDGGLYTILSGDVKLLA